ncbi:MAG: hypothetical protein ABI696_00890 [Rubrivivax sp.]
MLRPRNSLRVALAIAALLFAALPAAQAAPVEATDPALPPTPAELALRWTMNSVASLAPALPPAAAADAPPLASPRAAGHTLMMPSPAGAGVPDPAAYALMGLLLVGAGLVVRHWRRGTTTRNGTQRGASKKT